MSFNVFVLNNDLNKTSKLNLINFYQSIEYFYNNNDGTKIITINEDLTYKYSAKHLVNILCNISLTSLNSYNKSIRKIFNFKYNNPIVLNNDLNKTSKLNLINFYQSIEYFYNNNDGTKIITINEDLTYKYSAKHLVNILCNISLTSLNSYNKSIRKIFNFKYNNPIVLN